MVDGGERPRLIFSYIAYSNTQFCPDTVLEYLVLSLSSGDPRTSEKLKRSEFAKALIAGGVGCLSYLYPTRECRKLREALS